MTENYQNQTELAVNIGAVIATTVIITEEVLKLFVRRATVIVKMVRIPGVVRGNYRGLVSTKSVFDS
jgi:hypothetical protein